MYLADMDRAATSSQGIISYGLQLSEALAEKVSTAQNDIALELWASGALADDLAELASDRVSVVRLGRCGSPAMRLILDQFIAPVLALRRDVDVLHFPKGFLPLLRIGTARRVVTVHDDIPILRALRAIGLVRTLERGYFAFMLIWSVRRADAVVCDSAFTAEAVTLLSPRQRPIVVRQGVAQSSEPRLGGATPYLFVFASEHPHKRTREAVEFSWRLIRSDDRFAGHTLRVLLTAGMEPWIADSRIEWVRGPVHDHEVQSLIAGADLLVWSSIYEGFGRPPLEARSIGVPVVYAAVEPTWSLLEGATGAYEPGDFDSFALAATAACGDRPSAPSPERSAVIWQAAAGRMLELYAQVHTGSSGGPR